jgi:hypothetical protein
MEFIKGILRVILGFFGVIPNIPDEITIVRYNPRHGTGGQPQQPIPKFTVPNPALPNKNGRIYPSHLFNKNIEIEMVFSSKEAFFITEEEFIAVVDKVIWVEVIENYHRNFVRLTKFIEKFRPELYEKYKLLIEEN